MNANHYSIDETPGVLEEIVSTHGVHSSYSPKARHVIKYKSVMDHKEDLCKPEPTELSVNSNLNSNIIHFRPMHSKEDESKREELRESYNRPLHGTEEAELAASQQPIAELQAKNARRQDRVPDGRVVAEASDDQRGVPGTGVDQVNGRLSPVTRRWRRKGAGLDSAIETARRIGQRDERLVQEYRVKYGLEPHRMPRGARRNKPYYNAAPVIKQGVATYTPENLSYLVSTGTVSGDRLAGRTVIYAKGIEEIQQHQQAANEQAQASKTKRSRGRPRRSAAEDVPVSDE